MDARLEHVKTPIQRKRTTVQAVTQRTEEIDLLLGLLRARGEELGHRWGWKTQVAQELGLDQATLGKLLRGERGGVSLQTIDAIRKRSERFRKALDGAAAVAKATHAEAPASRPQARAGLTIEEALGALDDINATDEERLRVFSVLTKQPPPPGGWSASAITQRVLGWREGAGDKKTHESGTHPSSRPPRR